MAQAHNLTVPVSDLTHKIALTIKGMGGFKVRLWVARQLFRLGARVAGVNLVMDLGGGTEKV